MTSNINSPKERKWEGKPSTGIWYHIEVSTAERTSYMSSNPTREPFGLARIWFLARRVLKKERPRAVKSIAQIRYPRH
jgi:UDP-N-acetylglucosamine:LPS N-acetylglucosamine transferase